MATSTQPTKKSPVNAYLPFIAGIVVIALVIGIIAIASGGDDKKGDTKSTTTKPAATSGAPVLTYAAAKTAGTLSQYQWDDGTGGRCDPERGQVQIPWVLAPPCVPQFKGDNGGAIDPDHGVTADTVRIGYYVAPVDPSADALAKQVGAYDSPEAVDETLHKYVEAFSKYTELYGRKIELVKIEGKGLATDETAAQAAAVSAKEAKVFAVLGGPTQARSFATALAQEGILCIGSCMLAQPGSFYKANSPYIWPSISPDQSAALTTEFIAKQLKDKNAEFAGDAKYKNKKRTFVMLTYDSNGNFKNTWEQWRTDLEKAGIPIKDRVEYTLDINNLAQDSQQIVQKLKNADASTVIFTGDPIEPIYFTKEATKQGYFPEWVMSGTVYADTAVFARKFDQQQWSHAFGLSLVPPRIPRNDSASFKVWQCQFGTSSTPPADNTQAIVMSNVALAMTGIEVAGPKLTPENFRAGMFALEPAERDADHLRQTISYGDHKIWPTGTDYGGLDTGAFVWWDPTAKGEDETGTQGTGQYRYLEAGRQYRPSEIPSSPMGLFSKTGTVTYYADNGPDGTASVPPALAPLACPGK